MATKKRTSINQKEPAPKTLDEHPFFGLMLDDDQKNFRDAIWDEETILVIADAKAGSGKTTIAVATACLLHDYGRYDGCYYIRTNSSDRLGFLPGDLPNKEKVYMVPLYDTLENLGEVPYLIINDGSIENEKTGGGYWSTFTDTYVLGTDWSNKVIIIDEVQCMNVDALRALLTRCHDNCKVVCIGSHLQVQGIRKDESGFRKLIDHFKDEPWTKVCELKKNYRGKLSAKADMLM